MTDQDIFYEYEQVLLGKRKNYSSDIFAGRSSAGKEEIALRFFRCIFEKYLLWTPEEAYHELNNNIIEKMKLSPLVRFVRFPPEFSPTEDCFYIVAKAYPDKFVIDEVKQTQIVYDRVYSGKASRFPKHFFEDKDGMMRALFCLKYAIKEYTSFKSPEEMYKYFAFHGDEFLRQYKLKDAYNMNFNTLPIDYLNECMNVYSRYEYSFLYTKYRVLAQYTEMLKQEEKERKRKLKEEAEKERQARLEAERAKQAAETEESLDELADVEKKEEPAEKAS